MTANDPIKILVVDDLPEKLLVYSSILEEPGQEVLAARSAEEALRLVLKHEFAVILLDVNMPGMDGFEAASIIRGRRRSAHTPIIFVTAHADEVHALRGYSHGAVDYILAPVVPEILRTKVRVFVELLRKSREIQRQGEALRDLQAREHQRQLRETNQRLDLALEAGRMGTCEWDLGPQLGSWSPSLAAIFGYAEGEFTGSAFDLSRCIHPQDRDWVLATLREAVKNGESIRIEHRIIRRTGSEGWVELRGRSIPQESGLPRFVGVCMDISERKRAEAELARYRAHLEDLVRERTAALEASHEQLRLSDRMAAIGTLAAGLGHDMGNLLLPMRMRLDALAQLPLPPEASGDLNAIAESCEYLKRLSQGLRLFALNPEDARASGSHTSLASWWQEVAPLFRNVIRRDIQFDAHFPADLSAVAIAPHLLTQAVYNLVQNANDALRNQPRGVIRISAARSNNKAVIEVADNGPGMSEEVLRRCLEPFFTTKTRGISTGLGLALVHGAVHNAGGAIDIRSRPGEGAAFRLTLPIAEVTAPGVNSSLETACIAIQSARLAAYIGSLLRSLDFDVQAGPWSGDSRAIIAVVDDVACRSEDLPAFLSVDPRRQVIVLGSGPENRFDGRLICIGSQPTAAQARAAVEAASRQCRADSREEVPA